MKKLIYLLLLIPVFSFSQAPRGYYVMAGLNNTYIESSDLATEDGIGFRGGFNFNFGYHETYNYQAEIVLNQSYINLKSIDNSFENITNTPYAFSTFEFGFYFNYYIIKPDEDKVFIGLQAGPSISFFGSLTPKGDKNVSDKRYLPYLVKDGDVADVSEILFNGGFGLTGGYNDFRFDLRYTHGLSNAVKHVEVPGFRDDNNLYTGPELKGHIRMISFAVSYRLNKIFGME
jgi:hypothetical protein